MNELDLCFGESPWEQALEGLNPGDTLSAVTLLTLLEGEDEEAAEAALKYIEERHITLDAQGLPKDLGSGAAAVRLRQEQQLAQGGRLMQGLEENDPLRLYLEEVAATPAAGDPEVLAQKLLEGDELIAPRLAELMLSRVIAAAMENTGRGMLLLDLIQEGSLGLWQGISQYTGGDFEAHCDWWIRQYIAAAVTLQARSGGTGQKLRQAMEDYRDVDERLLTELGRNPTLEEIAQQLHISAEETAILEQMLMTARAAEQIKAARQPKEETFEDAQAVENTAYFQSRQRIEELLSALSPEDAQLISLRFGLEGGLRLTPQQTGQKLGLTADEVVAREAAALAKLRQSQ